MADPNARRVRLLEGLYRTFGVAAAFTPAGGGTAIPCTVRPATEDTVLQFGLEQAIGDKNLLKVRVAEVAAPTAKSSFAITGGATLKVMGEPRKAHQALEWVCEVREVAP
jgi:hypothetical protein